jgi:alkylation response protein AidB-like acyl-CoA dehydrogenase
MTSPSADLAEQFPRGGSFLFSADAAACWQLPEHRDAELIELSQASTRFVTGRVLPHLNELEWGDRALLRGLLREAGELGFFACEIPQAFGGLGLPASAAVAVADPFCAVGGFAVSVMGHSSIGTLPLVHFGTETAKRKYLPRLSSGELIGAYCLSEPGSGSDAQAARATATPMPDGSYVLQGTKAWVTNGGIADLFTVFAKVPRPDGDKLSAFLVERSWPGLSLGEEERKLGIRSSSTCGVFLDQVRVAAENLLGTEGQGAKIAFTILNVGRYKLGSATAYCARSSLEQSVRYAQERKSFGRPLAHYGAITEKLGLIAADIYAAESAASATIGLIDAAAGDGSARLRALEEYSLESSIVKILGSETLDRAVDEALQIHGGIGYTADLPLERQYRDSRINRIFEGTNEINRLLICSALLKRSLKGKLPLFEAAREWEASGWQRLECQRAESSDKELEVLVAALKGLAVMMLAKAASQFGPGVEHEQEVLLRCADIVVCAFAAECATSRARRLAREGHHHAPAALRLARAFILPAATQAIAGAHEVSARLPSPRSGPLMPGWLLHLTAETIAARRAAADDVLTHGGYPLA